MARHFDSTSSSPWLQGQAIPCPATPSRFWAAFWHYCETGKTSQISFLDNSGPDSVAIVFDLGLSFADEVNVDWNYGIGGSASSAPNNVLGWQHFGIYADTADQLYLYQNGNLIDSSGVADSYLPGGNGQGIDVLLNGGLIFDPFSYVPNTSSADFRLAELAFALDDSVWDTVAKFAAACAQMAAGFSIHCLRRNLTHYCPFGGLFGQRDTDFGSGGATFTQPDDAPTWSDHPRLYYPGRPMVGQPVAAPSFKPWFKPRATLLGAA